MKISSHVIIRQENNIDHPAINQLIHLCFGRQDESILINTVRSNTAFIPSLSLVALFKDKIVGHIFFINIKIISNDQTETSALSLASVVVSPEFQHQGIGKQILKQGLEKATALGYKAVFVPGYENYYRKFGFIPASIYHIEFPLNVPGKNFMALELVPEALQNTSGVAEYVPEFNMLSPKVTSGFTIETERLILKPLDFDQLVKYVRCDNSLETELNLNKSSRTISADLKAAFEETIFPNVADKNHNYLFSTIWTAISKAENKMVGDICMYGEPDQNGEVEIGYGTYDEFQNKGFMTEIVSAMIQWSIKQPGIKSVIASTEKFNRASFRVLEKNGFIKTGETDGLFHWKRSMDA